MEHYNQGIKHKWERRYNESTTTVAFALIIVGASFFFSLVFFWPQKYSSDVFNSRLSYHITNDINDYETCNKDYRDFVVDEPQIDDAMMSFYLFNVTNVPNVMQRGYKPALAEVGPYGYKKNTYKYNVTFNPADDTTVSFQEYVELEGIENDPLACSRAFFRMGRAEGAILNPCAGGVCNCESQDENITVVNPVFLRTLKEESAPKILGHLSGEVFEATKDLLENEFITAVRSFTVHTAIQEVYLFRLYMQSQFLLNASFNNLLHNYTIDGLANLMNATAVNVTSPPSCGLGVYGIHACPFLTNLDSLRYIQAITIYTLGPIDDAIYPSIRPLLIAANNISFLNFETGLPAWVGLTYYFGYLDFNFAMGYTMVNNKDFYTLYQQISNELAVLSFGPNHTANPKILFASNMLVKSIAYWIANSWLHPYNAVLTALVYQEWESNPDPVPCEPLGTQCVWQFAYMTKYRGNNVDLTSEQIKLLIDSTTPTASNPNNILYDGNVAPYYNAHTYCTKVYFPRVTDTSCLDVNFTFDDALVQVPSGLWGGDKGYNNLNRTLKADKYARLNAANNTKYFLLGCNLSSLQYEVFPAMTPFHDIFTIKYLNANADPHFTHQFDVTRFEELAWAQYGGGFVTYALLNVRTTFQIIRNGMWRYGEEKYYSAMMEFGSWAIFSGFPNHLIYNVSEARVLMYAMAANDSGGHAFRQFIAETGTTLVGDGTHYFHGVGAVGEVAYTPEFNLGNFSCSGENAHACRILNHFNYSSVGNCLLVESYYDKCIYRLYYDLSRWVTNCGRFVTSLTDPTNGISCSLTTISGQPHPYRKSRGNVMYTMLQAYTSELTLRRGLWCDPIIEPGSAYQTTTTGLSSSVFSAGSAACKYDLGGMFVNVAVKNLLFEGYTDPSVIKYINSKHEIEGIKFECTNRPYDQCGKQRFTCDRGGLVLRLPFGNSHLLSYSQSRKDEYFAPYFIVTANGSLLWPFSMTPAIAAYAESVIRTVNVTRVRNPVYAAYPGMNSVDKNFNKHVHEQARILNGMPGLFTSTFDTLDTGRKNVHASSSILKFRGNTSISHLPTASPRGFDLNISAMDVAGGTDNKGQQPMSLWSGFLHYPTVWMGLSMGLEFYKMSVPYLFSKQLALLFQLSQNGFSFATSKDVAMVIPLSDSLVRSNMTKSLTVNARRFIEDTTTWDNLRALGTPVDTYGMPYITPKGMASLEKLAGFPIFAGTPNNWGNEQWGGLEWEMVTGLVPVTDSQRTFIDYEPVTGRGLRTALRQQLGIRVETGPLFMSAFTGQQLCIPPNKAYSGSTGYGCFAYIPLLWFEDGRTVNTEDFYRLNDHFFTRPARASTLVSIGVAIGLTFTLLGSCLLVRENARRRTFKGRIYVD